MLSIDPLVLLLGAIVVVVFVLVASRAFPENMRIDPWRYKGPPDRSAGTQEDDDARFRWDDREPEGPPDRDR